MTPTEFLAHVLPETGPYCVVTIKNNQPQQQLIDDLESIDSFIDTNLKAHRDIYFSPASFQDKSSRKADNTHQIKSFFLDLDCGEGKPFLHKELAIEAVDRFSKAVQFPPPMLVDSGNGVHVYWVMDRAIPSGKWEPMAHRLKAACVAHKLDADPSVTSDRARILRIPDTLNFKDPANPKEVNIIREAEPVSARDYITVLQTLQLPEATVLPIRKDPKRARSETASALMGNFPSRFATIVEKSLADKGCGQIKDAISFQKDVEEPRWRAVLSVAQACDIDRDTAIHSLSDQHDEYDYDLTVRKASATKGPYTCDVFEPLAPHLCKGCKHRGKIKSPIMLGVELQKAAEPTDEELFVAKDTPVEKLSENVTAVYKPPFPYTQGKNGGVYMEKSDGEGGVEHVKICGYDVYPVYTAYSKEHGEHVVVRAHFPLDPIREFQLPLPVISDAMQLRNNLAKYGILLRDYETRPMANYMMAYVDELKRMYVTQTARDKFGWCEGNEVFVLGQTEYTKDGPKPSATSSSIIDFAPHMEPVGDLNKWRDAINVYNEPGLEPLAFAFLAGFGSPLMPYTGVCGATINLTSGLSGTGKTTAEKAALSIWGNPKRLMMNSSDTFNVRMHRLGSMGNIPVVVDEMTNTKASEVSDLLYGVTNGREKDRMRNDVNKERKNSNEWSLILLTSGNADMMSKVSADNASPDGEAARLMELNISRNTVEGASELFANLDRNFGLAGHIYAEWLVKNEQLLAEMIDSKRKELIKRSNATEVERFWIGATAATFAGAEIAKTLGLHDIDIARIEQWVVEFFDEARESLDVHRTDNSDVIDEFLAEMQGHVFVYNPLHKDDLSELTRARYLHGAVKARYNVATRQLYIVSSALKQYCSERRVNINDVLKKLSSEDHDIQYTGQAKQRMLTGMPNLPLTESSIRVRVFDCRRGFARAMEEEAELEAAVEAAAQ